MAGVNKNRIGNDDTYEVVAVSGTDKAIEGGLLVIPASGATNPGVQGIVVATNGAKNVLGVTARRAESAGLQGLTGTDADGFPVTFANPVNELTTVYKGCVVEVTYTAAAVGYGAKLCAAANGQVRAYVGLAETVGTDATALTGDEPDAIIGECRVVGGMSSGGGVGFALIY